MSQSFLRNLLITGAEHQERMKYATSLATGLLCKKKGECGGDCLSCQRILKGVHPNIMVLEPQSADKGESADISADSQGEIKIEQVRQIIVENQKANCEEGAAIFIITHMHQITRAAANALLKSIEENNPNKVFFALAPSRAAVLPTIGSRLVVVNIKPAKVSEAICEKIVSAILAITRTAPIERFSLVKQWPSSRAELSLELSVFNDTSHALFRAHYDKNHNFHHLSLPPSVALPIFEALNRARDCVQKNANPTLVVENMLFHDWPFA
jgi:hypothetical protein